jgi:hypothetical protein
MERQDMTTKNSPDFLLSGGGSLYVLTATNSDAIAWVEEFIGEGNGFNPDFPKRIYIEHSYVSDILAGIQSAEMTVAY